MGVFEKLKAATDIIKTFKSPQEYFLAHFNIKKTGKMQLRNGLVIYSPDINGFYTYVSALREYDASALPLDKDPVIVDIGACIGGFALPAAHKLKRGLVLAFEPNPNVFPFLKKNIEENGLANLIKPFELAVSGKSGTATFHIYQGLGSSMGRHGQPTKSVKVKTVTLKDIFNDNSLREIDFLKMDAEGAEYGIILSSPKSLLRKIRCIGLEYHETKGHAPAEIVSALISAGFSVKQKPKMKGKGIISAIRKQ